MIFEIQAGHNKNHNLHCEITSCDWECHYVEYLLYYLYKCKDGKIKHREFSIDAIEKLDNEYCIESSIWDEINNERQYAKEQYLIAQGEF